MEDPVGPAHRVVPVPADLEPDAAGVVAAGELHAVDGRERRREQAPLERDGDVVLLLVAPGPRQRPAAWSACATDERLVRIVERLLLQAEGA